MDTATHFVIGIGLAGLAYTDPAVAADPKLAAVVMAATILGSQAPDFDGLLRLKNNAVYIRNHRGWSHSVPFWFIWIGLISGLLSLLFMRMDYWHIALWTAVAVCFHVFTDVFNTYGTQAMRPFTSKWISWNIIHIFDPWIFAAHVVAILLWAFGLGQPAVIFTTLYIAIGLYYIWRTLAHYTVHRWIQRHDTDRRNGDRYTVIPTIHHRRWHVVKKHEDGSYDIGYLAGVDLRWVKHAVSVQHPAVDASKAHPDIQAFLYFSSYAVAEVEEMPWGYIVRWGDVRYRHRRQYPFVAVIAMDLHYQTINTYVGWLSEEKMEKKILVNP
ncbi:metal-dependent hydrolase [Paenibacillus sp. JX-17]|uniref:Metal-dependent hydrolase n=1 Tax=Paenibacillus lacisoli TaxID=3064525 RepID=A0ABT9CCU0_9BACL|nr:metal-dependent hydrolase [Paenibacillus sp. JX-17]MDO7907085.1 metal-dependent hydrolase [Paenibacillus sp. JX-17]